VVAESGGSKHHLGNHYRDHNIIYNKKSYVTKKYNKLPRNTKERKKSQQQQHNSSIYTAVGCGLGVP